MSIPPPDGWDSREKRSFSLRKKMGLPRASHGLYRAIVCNVEINAYLAGLDVLKNIWDQDSDTLERVLARGRTQFPYLALERFPENWPQIVILQAYFRRQRNILVWNMFRRMHEISDGGRPAD
ncbi:hypothetical protein PLEOSDRAFT_163750 [Pleurotus ostreatus PC15]|uniref:Uncharacterized protein n=2 Tax=Pleurotus TaxID=5320 RepID=A0A067NFJ7_PLEO1|nr:hypothetical protein CCMSSC00406_0006208 [Pleurotus cornucopiae]KDQ22857.1 hypothetical protein PLEOSDRAFT_163750 [Pleurotus ostreatus PC15]